MTDQPNGYHENPDAPIIQSSGDRGEVYMVTSVGVGQAFNADGTGDVHWVVTVVAENVNGHEVVIALGDTALEMIRRCDAKRAEGFR